MNKGFCYKGKYLYEKSSDSNIKRANIFILWIFSIFSGNSHTNCTMYRWVEEEDCLMSVVSRFLLCFFDFQFLFEEIPIFDKQGNVWLSLAVASAFKYYLVKVARWLKNLKWRTCFLIFKQAQSFKHSISGENVSTEGE